MRAFALTDIGMQRAVNQDAVFCSQQPVGCLPNLFVVADGMGGHKAGDFASAYAARRMGEIISQAAGPLTARPDLLLRDAVYQVNEGLYHESAKCEEKQGMGTTVVACTVSEGLLTVVNVGDSRLYVYGEKLLQVTRDHSLVEEMVAQGALRKDSPDYLMNKNIITRAVGIYPNVEVDIFKLPLEKGQGVLLCSDGLTNMVKDSRIFEILKEEGDVCGAARKLIAQANRNGGRDNIAVICIDPHCKGK